MKNAKVYFIKVPNNTHISDQQKRLKKLFLNSGADKVFNENELVGIKTHFGEKGCKGFVEPKLIKTIIDKIKAKKANPFITETSTLYVGNRSNAVDHIRHAYDHGFKDLGAPIIMADGLLGNFEISVEIEGIHQKEVAIAGDVFNTHAMIVTTHFKGHLNAGFGGAIKNIGMGLASRKGKLRQHSDMKPAVKTDKCTFCKVCMKWCPANAISEAGNKASIDQEKCIGCGECLTKCKFDAIAYNWGVSSKMMQEKMTEHALAIVNALKGKMFYFNFLTSIGKDCDCMGCPPDIICPDIGILASDDILAIDQASYDLVCKKTGEDVFKKAWPKTNPLDQIIHGEKIGLGTRKYDLVEIEWVE